MSSPTNLLPPYPPTAPLPEEVEPVYLSLDALLGDLWEYSYKLEIDLHEQFSQHCFEEYVYTNQLIDHWEEVYLTLYGKRYTIYLP